MSGWRDLNPRPFRPECREGVALLSYIVRFGIKNGDFDDFAEVWILSVSGLLRKVYIEVYTLRRRNRVLKIASHPR